MQKGFTLIELMVTVGIFVFMTALILANYTNFNSGTLLTNLAFDVALNIRQAQTYGVSVRAADTGTNFGSAYGVAFTKVANGLCAGAPPQPQSFVMFADNDANGMYTCAGSENVATYNLKQGAVVSSLCVSTNGTDCTNQAINNLYITFKRPDPSAIICTNIDGSCAPPSTLYAMAKIVVSSTDGSTRTIVVRQNGQVSVGN